VKHQGSKSTVSSTLVLLPPDEDDETHGRDHPQPFITNLSGITDELAIDRRSAVRQIEQYQNRAAIENTYTSIKKCAAKTTSKAFEIRWFHFGFACIIYNMWLLVDLLTQERIGVIETRKQPRIKLSRFLSWLERQTGILI
jgi:IS4 transposase